MGLPPPAPTDGSEARAWYSITNFIQDDLSSSERSNSDNCDNAFVYMIYWPAYWGEQDSLKKRDYIIFTTMLPTEYISKIKKLDKKLDNELKASDTNLSKVKKQLRNIKELKSKALKEELELYNEYPYFFNSDKSSKYSCICIKLDENGDIIKQGLIGGWAYSGTSDKHEMFKFYHFPLNEGDELEEKEYSLYSSYDITDLTKNENNQSIEKIKFCVGLGEDAAYVKYFEKAEGRRKEYFEYLYKTNLKNLQWAPPEDKSPCIRLLLHRNPNAVGFPFEAALF